MKFQHSQRREHSSLWLNIFWIFCQDCIVSYLKNCIWPRTSPHLQHTVTSSFNLFPNLSAKILGTSCSNDWIIKVTEVIWCAWTKLIVLFNSLPAYSLFPFYHWQLWRISSVIFLAAFLLIVDITICSYIVFCLVLINNLT